MYHSDNSYGQFIALQAFNMLKEILSGYVDEVNLKQGFFTDGNSLLKATILNH